MKAFFLMIVLFIDCNAGNTIKENIKEMAKEYIMNGMSVNIIVTKCINNNVIFYLNLSKISRLF